MSPSPGRWEPCGRPSERKIPELAGKKASGDPPRWPSSGLQVSLVAGEGAGEAYVRNTQQQGGEPFGTDREAAVGRHAVPEGFQVAAKFGWIQLATFELTQQDLVLMNALPARGDLHAAEQQVDAACESIVCGVGVEGSGGLRIVGDEHEVAAELLARPAAQQPLGLRVEVLAAARVPVVLLHQLACLEQGDAGYRHRDIGQGSTEQLELTRAPFPDAFDHRLYGLLLQPEHFLYTLDEAHLHVEREVLGEVAGGVGFLCPVDGSDFEDPFEDGEHHLLVELWRLGEVGALAVELQLELVGAALGTGRHELGGEDLRESVRLQDPAEGRHQLRLHLQGRLRLAAAHGGVTVVEEGIGVGVPLLLRHLHGCGRDGLGQYPQCARLHLEAARGARVLDHPALDLDAAFGQRKVGTAEHTLDDAVPVAQQEELDAAQVAAIVDPATQGDLITHLVLQLAAAYRSGLLTCGCDLRHLPTSQYENGPRS